jgi:uncharacterized delta-60 repeat protein
MKYRYNSVINTIIFCFLFTYLSFAQKPGDLDKTFGKEGKVSVGIGGYFDVAQEVALQSDGKIVVAGYGRESSSSFKGLSIARYLQDGTLDYDFGSLGLIQKQTTTMEGELNSIAIQKDDKILAVGYSISSTTNNEDITLVRFNKNGQLDKSFGNNGLVLTEISDQKEIGESVAIQPDGKIVVVGTTQHNPGPDIVLARYDEYGQLDYYFGNAGTVITNITPGPDIGKSLVIQRDGKIIVAGFSYSADNLFMTLLRYDSNGILDPTFGKSGIVITSFSSRVGKLDLVLQSDEKIILVGSSEIDNAHHFTVIRFNNNGVIDQSFGSNGSTRTKIGNYSEAHGVAMDSNGNIIVAGTAELGNETIVVARYNPMGVLDTIFGADGLAKVHFYEKSIDRAHSVIIDSNGNIIAAGETTSDYTTFGLIRLIGK